MRRLSTARPIWTRRVVSVLLLRRLQATARAAPQMKSPDRLAPTRRVRAPDLAKSLSHPSSLTKPSRRSAAFEPVGT